ncbi:hypothetical protein EV421DRAFT_1993093 [Armillaria borealis]|uniref:Uncharacterized protein n=1 Tax=Armillaria borealis TaxID=47425 RepID=A0AA39J219_9AGAR|nr:hypothetical protein EV421DRAFT_1993093 [Armillaria borealis]
MTTPQPANAYILNLPNELLEEILSPEVRSGRDYDNTKIGIITFCSVCKRLRDLFLWRLYQTIRYHDVRDVRSFLEVLPFQGAKYVVHLDLVLYPIHDIFGYDLFSMLDLLHRSIKDFKLLETLRLDIRPTPRESEDSGISTLERAPADVTPLSSEVVSSLNWVFRTLPKQLLSLSLSGFCLEDAIPGLEAARLPSLLFLSLDLNGSEIPDDFRHTHFLQGMPRLETIELPVQWCPTSTWFRRVFARRTFKHIKHSGSPCEWNACVAGLFQQSSSTLTTVNIGTISLTIPASVSFPVVTSLTLLDIEFGPEADSELRALLTPFFDSPLKTLEILRCHDIPAAFVDHFRKHWPGLKTLRMSELTTIEDEYDPPGIGYPYERTLGEDDAWDAVTRRELEDLCERRGVDASLDWEYAEVP